MSKQGVDGAAEDETSRTDFFRRIGAQGGRETMRKHGAEYTTHRQRAGETTRERYGAEHYRAIAQRAADSRQARAQWRNEALQLLLDAGWKIPRLTRLTLDDLPEVARAGGEALRKYLEHERPATSSRALFVSDSGQPLDPANTYKVMRSYAEARKRKRAPA